MTKVVTYDPAKLPSPPTTPSKYDPAYLAEIVSVINAGRGAGDGEAYASVKEAKSAANSIKRALRKFDEELSTRTRVWSGKEGVFQFALLLNTQPITGNAARQTEAE